MSMSIKLLSTESMMKYYYEGKDGKYSTRSSMQKGNYLKIGSEIHPEKNESIESSLYWFANENSLPSARLRTVLFVCDLLVLCGFVEYGYLDGEKGRRVQAVKASEKLQ